MNGAASEPPLVSVITPCHNDQAFIAEAIDSVRAQTLADWEMLVVDDASSDDSGAIVAEYAARDRRIRLVSSPGPGPVGAAGARNLGIRHAGGRYIAFLDSDDLWFPDKLAKQTAFMAARDLAFTYSSYRLMDARGGDLGVFTTAPSITHAALLKTNWVGCLTAIYDTRRLGRMYLPDIDKGHDYALWLAILKRIGTAHAMLEPLAAYRLQRASLSSNKLRAAQWQWYVYRRHEQLGRVRSAYYLCHYACHGLFKYPWRTRIRFMLGAGKFGGGGGAG